MDSYGSFWNYISQEQKDLLKEGQYLMNDVIKEQRTEFKDYSFLVFPFAKAYEGFLKQLFRDIKFITRLDYISDHLRLGKLLSPQLISRLGDRSLYLKIEQATSHDFAELVWDTWRVGRNQVFHYFPHNIKAVSFEEAKGIVNKIIITMEEAYSKLKILNSNVKTTVQNPQSI